MSDPRLARPVWRGRTNVDALTIACIEHAEHLVRDEHPDMAHVFVCTQGSYQGGSGDPLSAGTHDLGGVVDLAWCGHRVCVLALRRAGTAASHRTPAQGPWPDHIHLVVIGHPNLAPAAARQVSAYLAGRNGLANNGPDDGPRLDPIPRPVWPWPPEDDMADPKVQEQLDAIQQAIEQVDQKLDNQRERQRTQTTRLREKLDKAIANGKATKAELEAMRAELVDED